MNKAAKFITAAVSTVALAGGIGAGLAYADSPSGSPTAVPPRNRPARTERPGRPAPQADRQSHPRRGHPGRQKHRVVAFQRGPVEAVSDTSLTVKSTTGTPRPMC